MSAALRGTETGLQYQQAQSWLGKKSLTGRRPVPRESWGRSPTCKYPDATIGAVSKPWCRIHSPADSGMRKQVTRLGLLFTMTCLLVALAAFASANNLLFLILAAMIATLMVSEFISRLSLAGLELEFLLPEHLCAGRKLMGRMVIRNAKVWMPSFSIHVAASSDSGLALPLYFPVLPRATRIE